MVLTGRTGAMIFIAPVRFFVLPQREQRGLHAPARIRFARSGSSGDCTRLPLRGEGGESNFLRKLFSPDEVEHRISTDVPPTAAEPCVSASPAVGAAGIARAFPYEGKAAKAIFYENCFRQMRWNIGYPPTSPRSGRTLRIRRGTPRSGISNTRRVSCIENPCLLRFACTSSAQRNFNRIRRMVFPSAHPHTSTSSGFASLTHLPLLRGRLIPPRMNPLRPQ